MNNNNNLYDTIAATLVNLVLIFADEILDEKLNKANLDRAHILGLAHGIIYSFTIIYMQNYELRIPMHTILHSMIKNGNMEDEYSDTIPYAEKIGLYCISVFNSPDCKTMEHSIYVIFANELKLGIKEEQKISAMLTYYGNRVAEITDSLTDDMN